MTVRFPDQYPSLRAVDGLSDTAFRLAVTSVFWAATNATDGVVPAEDLGLVCARVRAPERFAAECVRRGAWHDARHDCGSEHCPAPVDVDGWVIHDYWKEQPTAADAEACEAAKSQGGRRGNHERWHAQKGIRKDGCEFCYPPPRPPSSHKRSDSDRISESLASPKSRSDFDFDSRSLVSQSSKSDARARDDAEAIIAAVAKAAEVPAGQPVTADQAKSAIAVIRQRAVNAGIAIVHPVRYFTEAIAKEPDVWDLLLASRLAEIENGDNTDSGHSYDPDPDTRLCRKCHAPEVDKSHSRRRTA